MRWELHCPAKLNLFLAVGPKDRRGYHPLRTVFQAIHLADRLTIDTRVTESSFECDDPSVPEANTVTKALRLAGEVIQLPPLGLRLEKRIPAQSGLGGGSSDAAGLLRGLQRVVPGQLKENEVQAIALAVGADVPFFLIGGRARAEGYGEVLTPLPDLERTEWLVVAKPPIGCDTASAFARLDEAVYEWRSFPEGDELYNDFERVAPRECLDLIERLLGLGARDAGLTGSGSAVFGRFGSKEESRRAAESINGVCGVRAWATWSISSAESLC